MRAGLGPAPNMMRPRVWWSSWIMRFAVISGLWYGGDITPVPKRIERVRSAAICDEQLG